jgi:hypothetical protein
LLLGRAGSKGRNERLDLANALHDIPQNGVVVIVAPLLGMLRLAQLRLRAQLESSEVPVELDGQSASKRQQ